MRPVPSSPSHQAAIETTARRYRLMLYVVSLLLLVALVRLGLAAARPRRCAPPARGVRACHRREFDAPHQLPAGGNRRPPEAGARRARPSDGRRGARLCSARGGSRARPCLVRDEAAVSAGLAGRSARPFRAARRRRADIVRVPDVAALPQGDLKNTLTAAGVRGWACVLVDPAGPGAGHHGFRRFPAAREDDFPVPVMRLAGDAVANALSANSSSTIGRGSRTGWSGRAACK